MQLDQGKYNVPTATEYFVKRVCRVNIFRENWRNFGKILFAPQKIACSYTYALRISPTFTMWSK